ncbi:MAG: glycosyltransferase family 2 protein [Thermaurantiacus sp.]
MAQSDEQPVVSLVVTPRERWGVARESLESIFETADTPFELIYVDGNSPKALAEWLDAQSAARGFRVIRTAHHLSPNQARNLGAKAATTDFVVFIDNDVLCSPGWLSRLVTTAQETQAEVIAPLICQGLPLHTQIHQAGATIISDIEGFLGTEPGKRIIFDRMHQQGQAIDQAPKEPVETQCCEFHCVLVRRDLFERIGYFDEEILATKEHLDFCIGVMAAGGRVLLEPRSFVTYLFPSRARPMTSEDWPYFLLRWSPDWQERSIRRITEKWGLDPDQKYLADRRRHLKWRWEEGLVKPLLRKAPLADTSNLAKRISRKLIRTTVDAYGSACVSRYDRMAPPLESQPAPAAR